MFSLKKSSMCVIGLLISIGLSAQPKKALKLVEKAKEHMRKGTLIEATVHLTQAIAKYEDYAEAYELRARSFQGMGKIDQAKQDYAKAVDIDPERIISLVKLVELCKEAKEWDKVEEYARIMLEKHPDNACPASFELAYALDMLTEEEKAHLTYETFLEMDCEGMDKQIKLAQKRVNDLK